MWEDELNTQCGRMNSKLNAAGWTQNSMWEDELKTQWGQLLFDIDSAPLYGLVNPQRHSGYRYIRWATRGDTRGILDTQINDIDCHELTRTQSGWLWLFLMGMFYSWLMHLLTVRITEAFGLPEVSLFCIVAFLPFYSITEF